MCRAYHAACAKPDLLVACVLGDGEAEARPLSIAWNANEAVDPATDGAVLPILHLSGDETGNFSILARSERERLRDFLHGNGDHPHFVEGDDPAKMHVLMARSLDEIILEIGHIPIGSALEQPSSAAALARRGRVYPERLGRSEAAGGA